MNVPELQAWISANYRKFEDIAGWVNSGFFRKAIHRQTSAGSAHAGLPIVLDANGHVDATMLNDADIDHGSIGGLTDDDHTQYALLLGRSGGQSLTGGTAANDDITIQGTSNATRTTSYVLLQPNGGLVGIGVTPEALLHVSGTTNTAVVLLDNNRYFGGKAGGGSLIRFLGITAGNVIYVGGIDSTAGASTIIRQSGSDIITLATALVTIENNVDINGTLEVGAVTATSINLGEDTLSVYDEGTWTPALTFGGGSTGITYASQVGTYTRIGNRILLTCNFTLTNKGSSTGNAVITGLPVAAASVQAWDARWGGMTTSLVNMNLSTGAASTELTVAGLTAAAGSFATLQETAFSNNSGIVFNAEYQV
jgi:hypothetical protein